MDFSTMTVSQIKDYVNNEPNPSDQLLKLLSIDSRAGVRQLHQQIMQRRELLAKEYQRLDQLALLEEELHNQGYRYIAGVDEVGRGPVAGPVVAAAVILPPGCRIIGLNDSKKVPAAKREQLAAEIKGLALAWSVQEVGVEVIEEINILQASLRAMNLAVNNLSQVPEFILVDAVTIPGVTSPQRPIIGGDALSMSIAAASILAKVTRDRMMEELDSQFPHYGFAKHKGYCSAEHVEALKVHGLSPVHRRSFCGFLDRG
ncbi:MAG: ribonuclease HII [Clostridia bacterium]|nr:ribonuclease HII [Clostridia bacterium]